MKDLRFPLALKCLVKLEEAKKQRKYRSSGEIDIGLRLLHETAVSGQYFPDVRSVQDYFRLNKYSAVAEKIGRDLKTRITEPLLLFCVGNLMTLEKRLAVTDLLGAVDTTNCEVLTISKHGDNLRLCAVDATPFNDYYNENSIKVITNILTLKKGDVLPLAFIPPKELVGFNSQAQFVSTTSGAKGVRPEVPASDAGKVLESVMNFINS